MGYKELWQENTKNYNELARKRLDDYCKIEKLDKKINKVLDVLKSVVFDYELKEDLKELEQKANRTGEYHLEAINDSLKELKDKIFEQRMELHSIYKVIEMNADDIKALQDKVFNGKTRDNINNELK